MIDIESEVFDTVFKALNESEYDITMSSEFVAAPASFPSVSLIELSNVPMRRTMTQELHENHAIVMYEINVYSDKARGRKREAKNIAELVDNVMVSMGFVRTMYTPVPNYADGTIFRLTMRYSAVVGKDHVVYRT